jgi:tetratricopeptide (TPR) repeat protein
VLAKEKPIISPLLVGRTREMEILATALRTVGQGQGQVVLLAGEAGIGKSRLVAELRHRATAMQCIILQGHCFERDLVFPYAPLIDTLRAFLGPQPAASVADLLGALAVELVKLLPELALAMPTLHPTPALDPEAEKRRLFETLVQFFTRLTQAPRPAPVLLILEDLHWGDETSLDFLHLLARRLATFPILLLATYRREEVSPGLRHLLAQVGRGHLGREVVLEPLTRTDMHTMLQAIFDLRRPVHTEFLEPLYTLTEGNPFFIEEVLKALVAAGDVFYADDGWTRKSMQELHIPPSVQEAVQRRTQQLRADARRLLTLAAVAGRRFDFALLQEVAGQEEHELLAVIKELVAAQLVMEETVERFAFRHALTRQAVYAQLLGRERQAMHCMIGVAIEQLYPSALDPATSSGEAAQVADLAYHFYEAGEWSKALDYARRAGEQAQSLYAPRAAVEQFTRALAAAQNLAQTPSLLPLYRLRGLAYDTLGEFEQARTDLATALELARAAGDRRGEWRLLLDLGQLWASRSYAQTGDYFQRALDLARTLDDPATLAHTLNRMGNWHLNVEQSHEALRWHQEALAIFQALNDPRGLAQTFDLVGVTNLLAGNPVQGALYFQQAIALFQTVNDRQGLASSLTNLPLCGPSLLTETVVPASMRIAERLSWHERTLQNAQEIGWRAGEAVALREWGADLGTLGQYGEAFDRLQRGLAVAQEIEHRHWTCAAHIVLGALYRDLLAWPAARHHLHQALTLANEIGSLYMARQATGHLILLLIAEHEFAQAETLLHTALSPELPLEAVAPRRIWAASAELALAQGDPVLALQIVDRLFVSAANMENRDSGAIPYLAKLRSEGLAALQQWAEAEATLQAALATAQAQGTPRLIWPLQVALGRLYQAQGRPADATQSFAAARAVMEAIAATVPDPALRDNFLHRSTALLPHWPPSSPSQAAKQTFGGLTRREREVAVLIAQGQYNREIAKALVVNERTIETHVSHILSKLGFTSRRQIAGWVVAKGLTKEQDDKLTG